MDISAEIDNLARWIAELQTLAQDDLQRSDLNLIAKSIEKFRGNWDERPAPESVIEADRAFLMHKLRTPFNTIVGLTQPGIIEDFSGFDDAQQALYQQVYLTALAMMDHIKTIYTVL